MEPLLHAARQQLLAALDIFLASVAASRGAFAMMMHTRLMGTELDSGKSRQQGFAAIAAIFLIVILAAMGGFMVSFSNTQQLTSAQDLQGSRAYWAARAGLEWEIASATSLSSAVVCPFDASMRLVASGVAPAAVDGFNLSVCFSRNSNTEGGLTPVIYRFTVVASSSGSVGSIGYIERSISASLER